MTEENLACRIESLTTQLDQAWARERRVRKGLLRKHGIKAALIGALILCFGASALLEKEIGTWTRPALGLTALCAGLVLMYGQRRTRGARFEFWALVLIGAWDVVMALSFVLTMSVWIAGAGSLTARWPWDLEPFPAGQPVVYPVALYLMIAAMVWGDHLRAVREDLRADSGR